MPRAPQHRRLKVNESRQVDNRRVSSAEAGYDWQWSKPGGTADQVRQRDEYLCQMCLKEGGLALAMSEMASRTRQPVVDHIIPAHRIGRARFHDMDNLQTLCDRHHAEKTAADLAKYGSARR